MKKTITMILAIAVTIFCIVSPTNTAKADTEPTTTTAVTNTTELLTETTESPQETKQPKQMKIKAKEEGKVCTNGKTVAVTKGFTLSLALEDPDGKRVKKAYGNKVLRSREDYKGEVKWTSSKPNIASVSAKGIVTGNKCGKTTITAEYGGRTSYVIVEVKKNIFTAQPHKHYGTDHRDGITRVTEKLIGVTSMYFDKNGNLIYTYSQQTKLTKAGKKYYKEHPDSAVFATNYTLHCGSSHGKQGCKIDFKNQNGKVIATTRQKILVIVDLKNKPHVTKYKIPKKYIKMNQKDIDLRRCGLEICEGLYKYKN